MSALAGLRYLTPSQTSPSSPSTTATDRASTAGSSGASFGWSTRDTRHTRPAGELRASSTPGRYDRTSPAPTRCSDYLFVRASQKEPFGAPLPEPGLSFILNLGDRSFFLAPEVQYSPAANLVLRLRAAFLVGDDGTEFGEKASNYRLEARLRLFF